MPYTATINSNSSETSEVVPYLKTFDFSKVVKHKTSKKVALTQTAEVFTEEDSFKKKFFNSLQQASDIRAGKLEAIDLDDLLNEL